MTASNQTIQSSVVQKGGLSHSGTPSSSINNRPYVISWNLTYRCNLACEHCYLDAGPKKFQQITTPDFADRTELTTQQNFEIINQIAEFAPEAITILTGGEPLLRRDILEIIKYGHQKGLWIVVGTNGVLITENLARILKESGVRGLALSLDALDAETHDQFRSVKGAFENTVNGAKLLNKANLPFIVQTTVGKHNYQDIEKIADFAYSEMKAKVFNLYFLVQTGRGQFVSDITPQEYNQVLQTLSHIQKKYDGKMLTNAKCAPHYMKHLYEEDPDSKFLKTFTGNAGGCPAGTHYMGIRPNGDMTPCPYLPLFGGNVNTQKLEDIWNSSPVFVNIRKRDSLGGNCGGCEFNTTCGGCRARAYGVTHDLMAADPLCDYQPGQYSKSEIELKSKMEYGVTLDSTLSNMPEIPWTEEAKTRIQNVPAFVRGMVINRVETYCRKNNEDRVTVEILTEIREKMPTPKMFGNQDGTPPGEMPEFRTTPK